MSGANGQNGNNGNTKQFRRGIPWAVDVDRIKAKIPDLPDGLVIQLSDIERCIQEPHTESRFKSVVSAWRRWAEREKHVILKKKGPALIVLDNSGKLGVATSGYGQGLRKIYVAGKRARGTGDAGLDSMQRKTRDHIAVSSANLLCIAATDAKAINYPDPIKQLE